MTGSTHLYFAVLSSALGINKMDYTGITPVQWAELCKLSIKDKTYGLLFHILNGLDEIPKELTELYAVIKKLTILNALDEEIKLNQVKKLLAEFEAAGLHCLLMKGFALKNMYPKPEYRFMADLDIFFASEELQKAEEVLLALGYTKEISYEKSSCHDAFRKEKAALVELHRALGPEVFLGQSAFKKWYSAVMENCIDVTFRDFTYKGMRNEDMFIFLVIHFSNHLLGMNSNLRFLTDLSLCLNQADLDYSYIKKWLKEFRLLEFASTLVALCNKYFGLSVSAFEHNETIGRLAELLIDDVITNNKHRLLNDHVPSYRFPILYKARVFRPVIWSQEFFRRIFVDKKSIPASAENASHTCRLLYSRWPMLHAFNIL